MEVTFDYVADDFELGVAGEGNFAREHNVQDDTKGPNIDLGRIILQKYLRSNIVWLLKRNRKQKKVSKSLMNSKKSTLFITEKMKK